MVTDLVLTDIRAGYRVLTLNRPDRLNSFSADLHAALMAALTAAEQDKSCRALILTGAGRGFCAGQDLSDGVFTPGETPDLSMPIEKYYNPLVRKLRSIPMPAVCAVNGVAAGAGANVALACDIVIAARSAKFIQAFAKLGLVPDSGGTWFLPRLVGGARARALAMLAEPVSAERAEAWGMIWKVVEDSDLMTEAHALAASLATQPTDGLALIKQALDASERNTLDAQLDLERDLREIGQRFLSIFLDDQALAMHRLIMSCAARYPAIAEAFMRAGPDRCDAEVAAFLRAAKAEGLIDVPNVRLAATQFLMLIQGRLPLTWALSLQAPSAAESRAQLEGGIKVFIAAYGRKAGPTRQARPVTKTASKRARAPASRRP